MSEEKMTETPEELKKRIAELIAQFNGENYPTDWSKAEDALTKIGEPAVELLIEALKSGHYIRMLSAATLSDIGGKRATEALKVLLKSADAQMRANAAFYISATRDQSVVDDLIPLLKDPDSDVRENAARSIWSLGAIGRSDALDALIEALYLPDTEAFFPLARAIAKVASKSDVEKLIPLLKHESSTVRHIISEALVELADSSNAPMLLPTFIPMLKDPEARIRIRAAQGLGKLGDRGAVKALLQALSDPDDGVKKIACKALADIGPPALLALAKEAEKNRNLLPYAILAFNLFSKKMKERTPESGIMNISQKPPGMERSLVGKVLVKA